MAYIFEEEEEGGGGITVPNNMVGRPIVQAVSCRLPTAVARFQIWDHLRSLRLHQSRIKRGLLCDYIQALSKKTQFYLPSVNQKRSGRCTSLSGLPKHKRTGEGCLIPFTVS
jgi:hypothetical protein